MTKRRWPTRCGRRSNRGCAIGSPPGPHQGMERFTWARLVESTIAALEALV
jgi:hypothetical protein